jgi:hypothetical protein
MSVIIARDRLHLIPSVGDLYSVFSVRLNRSDCQQIMLDFIEKHNISLTDEAFENFPWLKVEYKFNIDKVEVVQTGEGFYGGECSCSGIMFSRFQQDARNDYDDLVEITDEQIQQLAERYNMVAHYGTQLGDYHKNEPTITKTPSFVIIETTTTHHC